MTSTATFDFEQSSEPSWRRQFLSPLAILASAIVIAHSPLVVRHFQTLWEKEQYQFFPFVLAAIGWLLWSRWTEAPATSGSEVRWKSLPWWLIGLSIMLLTASFLMVSKWGAFASLNISLAAVFVWLGRRRRIHYLWGIWLLLWLMAPPPSGYDEWLIGKLQGLSSRLSSTILDLLGINHLMSGNVLTLESKQLFVDEACSGIVSVMSIVACAMTYSVWRNRSLPHLIALSVAGICWAVVMNLARICTIAIAYQYWDVDLSSGAVHEILGLTLFGAMFLALVSTDILLTAAFKPIDVEHAGEHVQENRLVRGWNAIQGRRNSDDKFGSAAAAESCPPVSADFEVARPSQLRLSIIPTALACILFLSLGVAQALFLPTIDSAQADAVVARALTLEKKTLPATIGPWARFGFEAVERERDSFVGQYSRTYKFTNRSRPGITVTASLDFPFNSGPWHELCYCYRVTGWDIAQRTVRQETVVGDEALPYVTSDLRDVEGMYGHLIFAGVDAAGEHVPPPGVEAMPNFQRRLLMLRAIQLMQVQVFATSDVPIGDELRAELHALFLAVHRAFHKYLYERQQVDS